MRVFYGEVHFQDKESYMSFAVVSKDRKTARDGALNIIKRTTFRNRKITHEFWTSKKVQGQTDKWGRTTVVSTVNR